MRLLLDVGRRLASSDVFGETETLDTYVHLHQLALMIRLVAVRAPFSNGAR